MKPDKNLQHVINIIAKNYHPEKIILFGSYARGENNPDSDIDLLIIKESKLPRYKRTLEIRKYLRGLKIPLDIIVYTKAEIEKWRNVKSTFVNNVIQEGKVVYG